MLLTRNARLTSKPPCWLLPRGRLLLLLPLQLAPTLPTMRLPGPHFRLLTRRLSRLMVSQILFFLTC